MSTGAGQKAPSANPDLAAAALLARCLPEGQRSALKALPLFPRRNGWGRAGINRTFARETIRQLERRGLALVTAARKGPSAGQAMMIASEFGREVLAILRRPRRHGAAG